MVTGGAGYVGCVLTPQLLNAGYNVTVYDIMYFGDAGLPKHPNLKVLKGDSRDTPKLETAFKDIDVVLHLACISNDPSFELNPELGKSINYDSFPGLVDIAKDSGVHRFIFAS